MNIETNAKVPTIRHWQYFGAAALVLASSMLVLWGLTWGLPTATSWAPDTIAGTRTLKTIGCWPDRWPSQYPPLHFFINRIAYAGSLNRWQEDGTLTWARPGSDPTAPPVAGAPGDEGVVPMFAPPVAERIGHLILISRIITALMSVGTVLIVAACGKRLFEDGMAGFLAGLTLATCAEWVYFSHLGTLDVPHMFWFAASLYAYIRVVKEDRWRDYALLGLFAALAMSTKDPVAGAYVGIAIAIAATRVASRDPKERAWTRNLAGGVHPKMWLGLVAFALPYSIISGLWTHPSVYVRRLEFWLTGPGTGDFNAAYEGPVWLLREALSVSARGLGWPMLLVAIIATGVALVRCQRFALLMLAPCIAYYLIVCQYTGMVYARILFPVLLCVSLLVGWCLSAWLARTRVPVVLRFGCVAVLFLGSIGYCAAMNLELGSDTRYRAEQWLEANVDRDEWIGVFAHPQYLPRFLVTGHRARPLPMTRDAITASRPRYLLLTSQNYDDFDENQRACMVDLLAGTLGYAKEAAASFSKLYLPPARSPLAIAGFGTRGPGKMSPEIIILKRTE